MNADRLLEHFERISDAADAVPRLRRFVRSLAVRGLLSRLDAKGDRSGFETPLAVAKEDAAHWLLPQRWAWACVSDCAEFRFGKMLDKAKNRGTPRRYLRNVNVRWFDFDLDDVLEMRFEDDELPEYSLRRGDILICEGGEPGRAAIWDERQQGILFQKAIHRVRFREGVIPEYFLVALKDAADSGRLATLFTGVTIKHLTGKGLGRFAFPLPPLAEQHRIVAKVDELMALCDRLEAAQAEREARRDRIVSASVARVTEADGDNATSRTTSARFHLDHLARLTTRPEHVKQLRQTILNLAVRGRLVPQGNSDESATQLLTHLRASHDARHRRVATDGGGPHEIPRSWVWACLEDLVVFGPQNGISPKPTESESAPKAITLTATTSGRFDDRYFKHVDVRVPENSEYWLSDGDLLFQRGNTREYVGIAAVYTGPSQTFLYPDLMIKVRLSPTVDLRYAHLAVTAPPARAYFGSRATGAQASMPKINQTILLSLPFPLPPLAEQRRIVAKVDELMALCDQLEASLASAATGRARLLEALLHEALEPAA